MNRRQIFGLALPLIAAPSLALSQNAAPAQADRYEPTEVPIREGFEVGSIVVVSDDFFLYHVIAPDRAGMVSHHMYRVIALRASGAFIVSPHCGVDRVQVHDKLVFQKDTANNTSVNFNNVLLSNTAIQMRSPAAFRNKHVLHLMDMMFKR